MRGHDLNLSIRSKGLVLIAVVMLFQLVFIGLIAWMQADYARSEQLSNQSRQLIGSAESILRQTVDAQNGMRGFIISGGPEFIGPMDQAVQNIPGEIAQLRDRVRGDPGRNEPVRRISDAADSSLQWLTETSRLARGGANEMAAARVKSGEGMRLVDQLRNDVSNFIDVETSRHEELDNKVKRNRQGLNWLLAIGGLTSMATTGVLALAFWRGISARFDALTLNIGSLQSGKELSAPLAGNDEIARVDRAFRQMATELAHTASALGESARQTRELYDEAPCGYHSIDADGTLIAMNRTELRWLGYREDEVIGKMKLPDLLTADSRNQFQEQFSLLKQQGQVNDLEYDMIRKDGSVMPVLLNSTVVRDAAGNFSSSRTTLFDRTQRKRAEATIRLFGDIVKSAPIGLIIWRLEDLTNPRTLRLVIANPAASALLGVDVSKFLGLPITAAFPGVSEAEVTTYAGVVQSGKVRELSEVHYQDERVAPNYWFVRAFPLPDQCVGVAFENVTERKRAEEQIRRLNSELERRVSERTAELADANRDLSQKNQENEMFVYSVSHDLRSPLVNLQGFSIELEKSCQGLAGLFNEQSQLEVVRDKALAIVNGRMSKSLGFIKAAVLRLSGIIDALLRLSRAGRVEYRWQDVDMNRLVANIVNAAQGTIQEKSATVKIGDLPPVSGDQTALEQVFGNLVGNALNYLEPGRVPIIEIGHSRDRPPEAADGCEVYFVRDNGLGVAEAYQQKIFQVFQRAHPEVSKGEGIGLAIVARIVERHHGRVWIESKVGQGSTFFVSLPGCNNASGQVDCGRLGNSTTTERGETWSRTSS